MKKWIFAAALIVIFAALFWYIYASKKAVIPPAATADSVATSTANASTGTQTVSNAPKSPAPKKVVLGPVSGDMVKSWDFKGAYTDDVELTQKAQTEIQRLKGLLGAGGATDYSLYISIANQYDLMGDGKQELAYLQKAVDIDSKTTGLAWSNAGQLFGRLGAYKTARAYLEKSIEVEPTNQSHRALLDFLLDHYPQDTAAIQKEKETLKLE